MMLNRAIDNGRLWPPSPSGSVSWPSASLAIGIYGLLAYAVARRTGETGARMTLGVTRGGVPRMLLRVAALSA